ncbi:hypothetical protein PRIPAC_96336 [Pristionchus pacificus]|uniref:RNA-directed DNA polymerase n=1 Tax=Pristionchus pacificus TaxID=54126 RepID=A0A2A6D1N0_PRIPA|nr:hypothetical protein PRIPAC_96336 [Pristionchus pacificus]|eukprot:PDM84266.1 hypothetical protein PRIPAC_33289 [Pristionchus pacificus]
MDILPKDVDMIEESTQLKKTGEESNPQQLPSVSGTQTRANAEKERKDALELKDRLKEEYDEITKAYKECKEKVKGIGSMRGHLTDLSDCFKKAKSQADKSWENVLLVVNKALKSDVNKGKEREFLTRLELNSLEEVEKAMTENREKVAVMRQMLSTMEEIEGVNNIPDLLRKVNTERENVTIERQGWQKMSEQLDELKGAMNLEENERMVDKWKAINDEFQNITAKLQSFQLDGDASGEELQSRIDSLEAKNLELASENGRLKERIDLQIAEMIKIDERNTEDEADARKWRAFTYASRFVGYSDDERSTFLHDRNHGGAGDMGGQVVDQYQTGVGSGFSHVNGGGSSTGGGNVMGRSIGLLANSLPRMNRYSGRKEDWDDFETGFTIRYGMMENTVAMSLLKDNLNGAARDALRSVPDEEKLKGIKSVLKWLRSRLSNETPFEELEVEKMLRHQKVDGKSVGRVCEELEEWTSKLHMGDDAKKETARKRQLTILYEGKHTEHVRLLTLFGEGASYSKMKAALVELEYLKRTEKESKGYSKGGNFGLKCFRCDEYGHKESQCGRRNGNGGGSSGGSGHYGTNGGNRGGYSGPNRGGYQGPSRGGTNSGKGYKNMQSYGYFNGYNNTRSNPNQWANVSNVTGNIAKDTSSVATVDLEVGKKTSVGFFVVNNDLGKVIIGGKGLEDIGIELKVVDFREEEEQVKCNEAIVLRNCTIEPGQLGAVWATGSEKDTVMLESSSDQLVEGIAANERIVNIPVFNDTKEELIFTKHQSVGKWRVVDGAVEVVSALQKEQGVVPHKHNVVAVWNEIREKLVKNREMELEDSLEKVLKGCLEEMIKRKNEVGDGKGDGSDMFRMPDSNRKYTMADLEIDQGVLYVLDRDHDRRLYVPKSERKKLIKEIHESVLVGHAGGKKMSQILQKEYVWGAMEKDVSNVLREWGEPWKVNEKYVVDMDDYKSRMMLLMRKAQEEVNERLRGEREKMKFNYDKRMKNNKMNEPVVGDRVYAYKERIEEKNPKLRIKWEGPYRVIGRSNTTATIVGIEDGKEKVVQLDRLRRVPKIDGNVAKMTVDNVSNCSRVVDKNSPLHWDFECERCALNPREMKEIWNGCPPGFVSFTFPTLKQYATLRTLIEKLPNLTPVRATRLILENGLEEEDNMTDQTVEETVSNTCQHALRVLAGPEVDWRFTIRDVNPRYERAYRKGLGEDVEESIGYGVVIFSNGVELSSIGGDSARWKWIEKMPSEWAETLRELDKKESKKPIKKLLIHWPRRMELGESHKLKKTIIYLTESNCWNVIIVMEPCSVETDSNYLPFLIEWSAEKTKTGWIRVIVSDGAVSDGTPVVALEKCHPWMRRDHWEFAIEAWTKGMPWNPQEAKKHLANKGFDGEQEEIGSKKRDKDEMMIQKVKTFHPKPVDTRICNECQGMGHIARKCPLLAAGGNNNRKRGIERGRPSREEEDVKEGGYKKKKFY